MKMRREVQYPQYEKGDLFLLLFVSCYLVFQSLNNLLFSSGLDGNTWDLLSKGILAVLSIPAWLYIVQRSLSQALLMEGFAGVSLLFTILFDKPASGFTSIAFNLLFVYIPLGLAFFSVKNDSLIEKCLYSISWPIEAICIWNAAILSSSEYSMSIGYCLLLPLLIRIDRYLLTFKWYDLLCTIIDFFVVLIVASRGPLICVVVFILLRVAFSNSLSRKSRIAISLALFVILGLLYMFYADLGKIAINLFNRMGRKSRTLNMLLTGAIQYDSGRSEIHSRYLNLIKDSPFIGHGLAGTWNYSSYPHSIILEILLAYGIPIGGLLLAGLLYAVITGVIKKNSVSRRIAQIFAAEITSFLWSGSFIMSPTFFMGLAACLRRERSKVWRRGSR